jgi:hypothetical protein
MTRFTSFTWQFRYWFSTVAAAAVLAKNEEIEKSMID